MQTLNPQQFGILNTGNFPEACEGPRVIHVPFTYSQPGGALPPGLNETITIDLSTFTQGLPAQQISIIQGIIVNNPRGESTVPFDADAFQMRIKVNNGFLFIVPATLLESFDSLNGTYCGGPFLATPPAVVTVELWNTAMFDVGATTWNFDLYFTNFPVSPFAVPNTNT